MLQMLHLLIHLFFLTLLKRFGTVAHLNDKLFVVLTIEEVFSEILYVAYLDDPRLVFKLLYYLI